MSNQAQSRQNHLLSYDCNHHLLNSEANNRSKRRSNKKRRASKRNQRNERNERNSKTNENVSQRNEWEGYYRSRTESNLSVGNRSAVSGVSTDRRSNRSGYTSYTSSAFGYQTPQRNERRDVRWDRDRLSREIWSHYETNRQTKDQIVKKARLKEALHKILAAHFPQFDVSLYIVGSTATGLATYHSDVDICIVMNEIKEKENKVSEENVEKVENVETATLVPIDESKPEDDSQTDIKVDDKSEVETKSPKTTINEKGNDCSENVVGIALNGKNDTSIPVLEKIGEILKNYNFVTKIQIISAKVPILKFNDRISGIEVTLNVNKLVSIRNTQLIFDYTRLDWRVQPLVLLIKAWAKDHNIKDAYNKSISSYSLVLMVIHYLQYACNPPVLPCLQEMYPNRYDPNQDIRSIQMKNRFTRWTSYNTCSLKELLIGFLDYYSYNFCYSKDAISVRLGKTLPKYEVQNHRTDTNLFSHWKFLSIEEPFDRTNTARSVYDEVIFEHILSVFRVSHYTLRRYPFLDSIMAVKQFSNEYISKNTSEKSEKTNDSEPISSDPFNTYGLSELFNN